MLMRIVSAIVAGLKAVGRVLGRVAAAPFHMLGGLIGGGEPAAPPAPTVSDEADDMPAPSQDLKKAYEQLALAVMQWCVDSLAADEPAPTNSGMSRGVSNWLPGLTREECISLATADIAAIVAHLRSHEPVPGVRSVRPLDRIEWPPESAPWQDPGKLLSVYVDEDIEPSSAAIPARGW